MFAEKVELIITSQQVTAWIQRVAPIKKKKSENLKKQSTFFL